MVPIIICDDGDWRWIGADGRFAGSPNEARGVGNRAVTVREGADPERTDDIAEKIQAARKYKE